MIYSLPSTPFDAWLTGAPTGLVGTLTVRVEDADTGSVVVAETTSGITEPRTGKYKKTLTAPDTEADYFIVWKNGSTEVTEELVVSLSAPTDVTNIDKVRLLVGDADDSDELLSDNDISDLLSTRSVLDGSGGTVYNIPAAAADAAGAIAAKYARNFNFGEDGQTFQVAQRVGHYQALERSLRARSGGYSSPVSLAGTATT